MPEQACVKAHRICLLEDIFKCDIADEALLEILVGRSVGVIAPHDNLEAIVEKRLGDLIGISSISTHIAIITSLILIDSQIDVNSLNIVGQE